MITEEQLGQVQNVIERLKNVTVVQDERRRYRKELMERLRLEREDAIKLKEEYETTIEASRLIATSSDNLVESTLNNITSVINKALVVLFPDDTLEVSIDPKMVGKYPNFVVTLSKNGKDSMQFKHSGTGLSQIVSFLFAVTLIDLRRGRKVFVMDELLSGMHPEAKQVARRLIKALSNRFQFVIIEYNMDIGQEYELIYSEEIKDTVVVKREENNYYIQTKYDSMMQGVKQANQENNEVN